MLITVAAGFPLALVLAWYHGPRGPQRVTRVERGLLGAIAVLWLAAVVITWLRTGGG